MKDLVRVVIAAAASIVLAGACSGALENGGPSASSSGGSNGTSGSTGSSGDTCPPCPAPPDPSCKGTGPCGCGPWDCSDGGPPREAGADAGEACTWSKTSNPCGPGKYCASATCGKGTCVAVSATETQNKDPICGCDGVTYWNASVAANKGMSVASAGVCGNGGAVCGGFIGAGCPGSAECNYQVPGAGECGISDPQGTCWMLPKNCPQIIVGASSRICNAMTCKDECSAIRAGQPWYTDNLCPQ